MTPLRASGVRRLSKILHHASEPFFLLDRRLRLVFVNRAWEALTGLAAETVQGLECRLGAGSDEAGAQGTARCFAPPPEVLAGRAAGGPALIVHASGERLPRRLEFLPLRDSPGQPIGYLGWVQAAEAEPRAADSEILRLRADLAAVRAELAGRYGTDQLVGRGPGHRRLLDQVAAAASSRVPVLVLGETGTGRRLVARTIHHQAAETSGSLRLYDCAALPAEVIERELTLPPGGGRQPDEPTTLLLTDILELPRDVQGRLLDLLDGPGRLIATARTEPEAALRDGRLRTELYFALTTFVVRLLPLRERIEELPLLAQHFLDRANQRGSRAVAGFAPGALRILAAYDWPGNLTELARVVDAAHQRASGDVITAADLPAAIQGSLGAAYNPPRMAAPVTPLDETLTMLERRLIELALTRARQNKSKAAELLAISRPRLYRRIKELQIADAADPDEPPLDGPAAEITP